MVVGISLFFQSWFGVHQLVNAKVGHGLAELYSKRGNVLKGGT